MSILIKGMKMPKHMDLLRFNTNLCGHMQATNVNEEEGWFEVVELKPHGRLIDADALTDDLEFDIRNDERVIGELKKDLPDGFIDIRIATTQDDKEIKQNCIVLLREQPTIIEAEVKE